MKKFGLEKWRTMLIVSLVLIVVFVTGPVLLDDVLMGVVWIFIGLITIFLKSRTDKYYFFIGMVQILLGIWFFLR